MSRRCWRYCASLALVGGVALGVLLFARGDFSPVGSQAPGAGAAPDGGRGEVPEPYTEEPSNEQIEEFVKEHVHAVVPAQALKWLKEHGDAVCRWIRSSGTALDVRCASELPLNTLSRVLAAEYPCAQDIVVEALALDGVSECHSMRAGSLLCLRPTPRDMAVTEAARLWGALPSFNARAVEVLRRDIGDADNEVRLQMLKYLERICDERPAVPPAVLQEVDGLQSDPTNLTVMDRNLEALAETVRLRCGQARREEACSWHGQIGGAGERGRQVVEEVASSARNDRAPSQRMVTEAADAVGAIRGTYTPAEILFDFHWGSSEATALRALSEAGAPAAQEAVRDLILCLRGFSGFEAALKRRALLEVFRVPDPAVVGEALNVLRSARHPQDAEGAAEYLDRVCLAHPPLAAELGREFASVSVGDLVPPGYKVWRERTRKAVQRMLAHCRTQ